MKANTSFPVTTLEMSSADVKMLINLFTQTNFCYLHYEI